MARPPPGAMIPTPLDDRPDKATKKKRRLDAAARAAEALDTSVARAPHSAADDVIEDMARREKRLKKELNARAKKFAKGEPVAKTSKIADRKTKAHVRYAEKLADDAATSAALFEKWLLPHTPGAIVAEGDERTFRFKQADIAAAVDVNAQRKAFDLELPTLGPYAVDFTPNGRDLVLGGRRGHLAMVRWGSYRLVAEEHVKEVVKDVKFLHNGQYFAAAQRKYAYIYDKRGIEIHCLKDHVTPNALEFLPHHFLLCSIGEQGVLRYQDVTHGALVAQHRTKLGACEVMRYNPQNAIVHCGHGNGTVTLWSPNAGHARVKMLCHRGPIRSLAIDPAEGRYMATSGADAQVKIWDLRTYKEVHAYYTPTPATYVDISQRGMLALAYGGRVQVWDAALSGPKQQSPYLNHQLLNGRKVRNFRFAPYDDALGVGHSGGFTNLLVPGAGEPNYDSMVANPFETRNQRREQEVSQVMDKLPPETIQLDADAVGKLRAVPKEVQAERRKAAIEAQLAARREQRDANAEKTRMKGKNRVSKRYRKKQQNVVDDKKLRARMKAEEAKRKSAAAKASGARRAGDGAEGGGAMPGQSAGAASDAPEAPKDVSKALRRFYK